MKITKLVLFENRGYDQTELELNKEFVKDGVHVPSSIVYCDTMGVFYVLCLSGYLFDVQGWNVKSFVTEPMIVKPDLIRFDRNDVDLNTVRAQLLGIDHVNVDHNNIGQCHKDFCDAWMYEIEYMLKRMNA